MQLGYTYNGYDDNFVGLYPIVCLADIVYVSLRNRSFWFNVLE